MQNVLRREIAQGVNLTCVTAYKFKTGCLSITLMTQLSKKTASLNAVLPSVLRRGTSRYPDMESIEAALDDLYGARIEPVVRKKGEIQCIGLYADFLDDAYAEKDSHILEKTASLMGEMLLSPSTKGGRLRKEYVDGERENLIDDINADINDKRYYASRRLNEIMCKGENYGVSKLGTVAEASKISVYTLTKHYKEVIASSNIEIFYCGSADIDRVERAVKDALSSLPRADELTYPENDVKYKPDNEEPRYCTEKMAVTQGKLVMGYRLGNAMMEQNHAAMMVFNALFGGAVTSKLFMNVREKLALCYYANSSIDRHKGIMVVSSGIEFSKFDEALNEITAQLEAIKNGEIEQWELDGARRAVVTAISASIDSPIGLESLYLDKSITGMRAEPEELAALAEDVRLDEVVKIAKGVVLDSVYFLTGDEDNA